jgi:hypothetical protein
MDRWTTAGTCCLRGAGMKAARRSDPRLISDAVTNHPMSASIKGV